MSYACPKCGSLWHEAAGLYCATCDASAEDIFEQMYYDHRDKLWALAGAVKQYLRSPHGQGVTDDDERLLGVMRKRASVDVGYPIDESKDGPIFDHMRIDAETDHG